MKDRAAKKGKRGRIRRTKQRPLDFAFANLISITAAVGGCDFSNAGDTADSRRANPIAQPAPEAIVRRRPAGL
jgi:hypothetical protein